MKNLKYSIIILFVFIACIFLPAQTNQYIWRYVTGGKITANPAIAADGSVIFGSTEKTIYALNPDGTEKWTFKATGKITAPITIRRDGIIYTATENGKIYALFSDGRLKWEYQANTKITSGIAIGFNGTIYFGSWDNKLYALGINGVKLWEFNTQGNIKKTPLIARKNMILIYSEDGNLYAVSVRGKLKWQYRLGFLTGTPAIDNRGNIYLASSKLISLDPDGNKRWSRLLWTVKSSVLIGKNDTIIVGSKNNKCCYFDVNGRQIKILPFPTPFNKIHAIDSHGNLYYSAGKTVYQMNSKGKLNWKFRAKGTIGGLTISQQGIVYLGASDWIFYAVKATDQGLFNSSWPLTSHDNRNTHRYGNLSFLTKNEYGILKGLAYSSSQEMKMEVLNRIQSLLFQHEIGKGDSSILDILVYLSEEGSRRKNYLKNRLINDFIPVRIKACQLLETIGGELAKTPLIKIITTDNNLEIKGEAMLSLAKIAYDTDGLIIRTIVKEVRAKLHQTKSPQFIVLAIKAIKILANKDKGLNDISGYNLLIDITQGPYSAQIKKLAADAVANIP